MNNTVLFSALSFIGGAAISGFVVWKIVDKKCEEKYEALYQEELKSIKEHFTVPKVETTKADPEKKEESQQEIAMKATNKPTLADYAKNVRKYTNYSNVELDEEKINKKHAYVINPDEYGEDDEYEQQELTFYADGILADEDDTILDADEVLGKDSINHIGDYEDDAVHVKNEARKVYYEVLVDNRSYEDATGKKPHLDKDEED
jgi:hypothetical protein